MKVTRGVLVVVALCCLALGLQVSSAHAQIDPGKDPDLVGSAVTGEGGCIPIPDDAYDGSIGSMACFTVPGPSGTVTGMNADVAINHTWAGDLVIKVANPSMDVLTVMSRPGFAEPADDGTGCCGNNADMTNAVTINFADGNATDAENLGAPLVVVCQDDGLCDYFPNPDTGPGTDFAQFIGQDASGDWMICVGDAAGGDAGEFCTGDLNLSIVDLGFFPGWVLRRPGLLT